MTEKQFNKVVERLRKYRVVRLSDGDELILWESGDISLQATETGNCIICTRNLDLIKRILVDPLGKGG